MKRARGVMPMRIGSAAIRLLVRLEAQARPKWLPI